MKTPSSLTEWRQRWTEERWQLEQRLQLIKILLGDVRSPVEAAPEAVRALRKWVEEQAGGAEGEIWRVLEELVTELALARSALQAAQDQERAWGREREGLQLLVKEQEVRAKSADQENVRLKRWLTSPVEQMGSALEERTAEAQRLRGALTEARARLASLEDECARQAERLRTAEREMARLERALSERERAQAEEASRTARAWQAQMQGTLEELAKKTAELEAGVVARREEEAARTREREEAERERARLASALAEAEEGRRAAEAAREAAAGALAAAREEGSQGWQARLQAQARLHEEVVFGVVNQARNAFGIIRGGAQLALESRRLKSPVKEHLEAMIPSVDQAEALFTKVLELIQLVPKQWERILAHEVAAEAVVDTPLAGLEIRREGEPAPILADRAALRQALREVLMNAHEAVEVKGAVTLSVVYEPKAVRVKIQDTGKGLLPQDLRQAFIPFFSTKEARAGLGLTVVQRMVEQMGGMVMMSSELEAGTTVLLSFPRVA